MKRKRIRQLTGMPWGFAVAMLTASLVTLLCVWMQIDPDVILVRAAVAGLLAGIVTRLLVSSLQALLLHP